MKKDATKRRMLGERKKIRKMEEGMCDEELGLCEERKDETWVAEILASTATEEVWRANGAEEA